MCVRCYNRRSFSNFGSMDGIESRIRIENLKMKENIGESLDNPGGWLVFTG